jgi:hypothetical protein
MTELLSGLENSAFAIWVRESGSIWSYPTIIFLHSLGLSFVVGINAALDLRLLGIAPRLPVAPLERLFPIMWAGFWINTASGLALFAADATTMGASPVFFLKMSCIVAAVVTMVLIRRLLLEPPVSIGDRVPVRGRVLAIASIALWMIAITAGRLTAYLGPVAGLKGR